jgi:CheY-like chemotaxis protein
MTDGTLAAPLSSGRRVLLADDNRDGADSLAMLLKISGHDVRVAYDGPSAVSLAQAFRPDVAIVDIDMPGMDGYAVARILRGESWASGLILLAVTGWGQEADRNRAVEAGFDSHLTKPVDPERLSSLLSQDRRRG